MKLVHAALRVQWIESPAANTTCSLLTVSGNCTLSDIAPSSLPLNCVDHGLEAGCQSDIEPQRGHSPRKNCCRSVPQDQGKLFLKLAWTKTFIPQKSSCTTFFGGRSAHCTLTTTEVRGRGTTFARQACNIRHPKWSMPFLGPAAQQLAGTACHYAQCLHMGSAL
eukprot:1345119-Amphidinium_carterae.1